MALYGKVEYWNERYTKDKEPFEWYQRYSNIRHLLPRPASRVLNVGCGSSLLSTDMLKDNDSYSTIVNIDYSPVIIERQKSIYKDDPNQEFECADVTQSIPYPDESFDLIICKGTLDSVLCSDCGTGNARRLMEQCERVLKEEGTLVIVTYGTPENRMKYFEDVWGNVETYTVPKPRVANHDGKEAKGDHYVYVCKKEEAPGEKMAEADGDNSDKPEVDNANSVALKVQSLTIDESKGDEKKEEFPTTNESLSA